MGAEYSDQLEMKFHRAARAVTASFGIATLNEEIKEGCELTHSAQRALYVSKENERNRSTHVREIPNP